MLRKLVLALTGTMVLAFASPTPSATACGNGVERRINQRVQLVVQAERSLSEGDPQKAAAQLLPNYPRLRDTPAGRGSITDRALRVMATSLVRAGGSIDATIRGKAPFAAKSDAQRAKNIAWSISTLKQFLGRRKGASAAQTAYAEALAASTVEADRKLALKQLTLLEADDVMSSAFGYAALAKLRRAAVAEDNANWLKAVLRRIHEPGAVIAEARCRKMTKDESICSQADRLKAGAS